MKYVALQTLSICINMPPRDDDHKLRLFPRKKLLFLTTGETSQTHLRMQGNGRPEVFHRSETWVQWARQHLVVL